MFYESQLHTDNCFVTLTYSEEQLPANGTLVPDHYRLWLKRLRRAVEPHRFRYFVVGEYGDETHRPHYHACLFGLGQAHAGIIDRTWGHGFTATAEFNQFTAQYTAGYTVKKLTRKDDPRLNGRHPEFARQSNRPGIGAGAMALLAEAIGHPAGLDELDRTGDVPTHLMIGKKKIPIGRYLRNRLRSELGMPEKWNEKATRAFSMEESLQLFALYKSKGGGQGSSTLTLKQTLLERDQQSIWNIEARDKIAASRRDKKL